MISSVFWTIFGCYNTCNLKMFYYAISAFIFCRKRKNNLGVEIYSSHRSSEMIRQHGSTRPSYGHTDIDQVVVKDAVRFIASNGGQLTFSELLNMMKYLGSQVSTLYVGNLQKILNAHPHLFELDESGREKYQTKVMLAFEVQICEQPRKCNGFPICKALHICKYFIQDKCRASVNHKCSFGHDLHSSHNLAVLTELNMEQIEPLKLKDWIQKQHNNRRSRPSRPPKICNFYNTAAGCDKGENCSFLHLCRYFVNRSCKFCLLYTSDAADDMQCVDLGGRRIIKK